MKISLIGNCQAKALTWYLSELDKNFDVKYISAKTFLEFGMYQVFRGKPTPTIIDTQKGIQRLQNSDFIIYQHIKPETSKNFNFEKIKYYGRNAKLISFSHMMYDSEDPEQAQLKGMELRAKKFNIDIPANEIIKKHGDKVKVCKEAAHPNHPCSFYFLELVRGICVKAEWEYYSNEQYHFYLKEGYPFC